MAKDSIKTTTHTETRTETLTAEEERVVRMVRGLSEAGDAPLEFVASKDAEVNARLKAMEAELMAVMHNQGPLAKGNGTGSAKNDILARLKQLEDE